MRETGQTAPAVVEPAARAPKTAMRITHLISITCLLVACGGDDAAIPDAASGPDAAGDTTDAPWIADAPTDLPDAGPPLSGFGDISGDCGVLDDDEWSSDGSFEFRNAIDLGTAGYTEDDFDQLTAGGQEIILDGNAGGNSIMSEVFAYEMLHRCELADLLKTETEISYDTTGKITDFLVSIDSRKVGVSVTRAVGYPRDDPYTVEQARALLEGKLADILESTANVSDEDAWVRQILHVLAYGSEHAESLATAYAQIDATLRADTVVIVTVTDGNDEFIY